MVKIKILLFYGMMSISWWYKHQWLEEHSKQHPRQNTLRISLLAGTEHATVVTLNLFFLFIWTLLLMGELFIV